MNERGIPSLFRVGEYPYPPLFRPMLKWKELGMGKNTCFIDTGLGWL